VLDDWGRKYDIFEEVLALERPLTLAVIPHLPYSARIAREGRAAGLGIIVHFPMQPKAETHVEPTTILTTTPDAVIKKRLDDAFRSVAGAQGMNNHQGSAATSDLRVMRTVLGHLKSKNVFFLDSNVISTTVGPRVAKEIGIPFTKRDVFLDNELDEDAIVEQLRKAKRIALSRGSAVAIGHDHDVTLAAIRRVLPEIEREGVRLVLAKDLLLYPEDDIE